MKKHYILTTTLLLLFNLVFFDNIKAESVVKESYKVGVNDSISIEVVGHSDLSRQATVSVDGTIAFPHIGSLYVKDKSLAEIEEILTRKLSDGYIKFPVVSVSLGSAVSKKIFIHGEVRGVGIIQYEKDLSIIKALSMAGGINESGLFGKVVLRRREAGSPGYNNILEAKLDNGLLKNKKVEDMILQTDDILIVERSESFFLQGNVLRPGPYILEEGMTISRAITVAGGIAQGGLHGKVIVRRKEKDKSGYTNVIKAAIDNGVIVDKTIEDELLQPDDILKIERAEEFFIQGEVVTPGKYEMEYGMTISRAITLAGGIDEGGLHGKVILKRKVASSHVTTPIFEARIDNGNIVSGDIEDMLLEPDDILRIEKSESFFIEGEVTRPAEYILEHGMTVGRAITVAGGITEGGRYGKVKVRRKRIGTAGYDDIEIDLRGIIEGAQSGDMELLADDILVVERSKTYIVYGEVNSIGEYALTDDTTVFKAILQAGGFNKYGSESKVSVLRRSSDGKHLNKIKVDIKKVLEGDPQADIYLNPDDIVIVSAALF